jgi:hypothetical protein
MKIYRSAFNMQRRQREEEICRILERGSAGMSQAAGSMSESLGKKKKKNKARNKFRESSSVRIQEKCIVSAMSFAQCGAAC